MYVNLIGAECLLNDFEPIWPMLTILSKTLIHHHVYFPLILCEVQCLQGQFLVIP